MAFASGMRSKATALMSAPAPAPREQADDPVRDPDEVGQDPAEDERGLGDGSQEEGLDHTRRLRHAGHLAGDAKGAAQPPIANISIRGRSDVASVRSSL